MTVSFPEGFPIILGEGSMYERLRRGASEAFDPDIAYAGMLYDDVGRDVLAATHREYLDIGQREAVPMVAGTPTWRAGASRIARSKHANEAVNADGSSFMKELRASYGAGAAPILIAGIIGPAGDGYKPQEAPDEAGAIAGHAPQIAALAESGVDLFKAQTLPAFDEARGIARLLAETEVPYVISFVLRRDGTLLDGTRLDQAINVIDDSLARPPAGYNINCVHASVFATALMKVRERDSGAAARVLGIDANTSAKTPEELDGLEEIDTEAPADFGRSVASLRGAFGLRYLGGCCGSTTEHIEELARCCGGADDGLPPGPPHRSPSAGA